MGSKDYIKIDRGETVSPAPKAGELGKSAYHWPAPTDREDDYQARAEAAARKLDDLEQRLEKLSGRARRNSVALAKIAGEREDRAALRKSAPPADVLADLRVVAALEAVDENSDRDFAKAVAALRALDLGAGDLSTRISQIRRAAIQKNPKMLEFLKG